MPTDAPASERRGTDDIVDDPRHTDLFEHAPDRLKIPQPPVLGARAGLPGSGPRGEPRSRDLLCRTEVALGDDARLAVHASRFDEVVVGLAALLLADDRCHI